MVEYKCEERNNFELEMKRPATAIKFFVDFLYSYSFLGELSASRVGN